MPLNRRQFLKGVGAAGASGLAACGSAPAVETPVKASKRGANTWHFWDLWHLDHSDNLEHVQGEARWQEDATYFQDDLDGLACWPTVYRDRESGKWRMLHSLRWLPYTLCIAESDDGRTWKPLALPDIQPAGKKRSANHIYTLPLGSGGGVYLDPVAEDGFPFKVFCRQHGKPVYERALADPGHRWHTIAKAEGLKKYMSDSLTVVSKDGLNWQERFDRPWSLPDWHPEPPLFGFYNAARKRHMMTVRPGWGDRRVCIQDSADGKRWSGPELLFQPDPLDRDLIEHYGMPVFPYGNGFVGLLWVAHFNTSEQRPGFNRSVGPLDCQLAYSYDGVRFSRGFRRPVIKLNPSGKPGGGGIEPSCLVETDKELRIYSGSSKYHHGMSRTAKRVGDRRSGAVLLHTLRKDGLMFLRSRGAVASFITKPLVLFDGGLTLNGRAPVGEIRVQVTDMDRKPLEGFTFEDAVPLERTDNLNWSVRWKKNRTQEIRNKVIRLEVRMHHAELYAFRGRFHFLDAQDQWMVRDGKPIDSSLFDF